jgi:3D-(3,5/4)-trihydroxycyclohexane-1,2-dione acylhydrolase (decyclizing)
MGHAAIAYAKHLCRRATMAVTASVGPGSTNLITAAATATVNRIPLLLLPSDLFANRLVDPVLQQLEHPSEHDLSVNDAFRPVSRFYARISRPEQLLAALPEAMRVLADPAETGAVVLSLPEDVQAEAFDWPPELFEPRTWRIRRPPPERSALLRALTLLQRAERPLLIAGGGVVYSEASDALGAFAERFGVPVALTQAGKSALPWNHPWNVGPIGANGGSAANALAREADLIVAVGTRLSDFTTASMSAFAHPAAQFLGLNVAPFDAHKLGAEALVADARDGLLALTEVLHDVGAAGSSDAYRERVQRERLSWNETVSELRALPGAGGLLSQAAVMAIVNEAVGEEAVVINAAGSMPGDLLKLWRSRDPQSYHVEYGFSCMGYEVAAGLGVKQAEPEREVVVFVGDGSYLMMNSEIVTAVAEGLRFTIVLVENGGFQSIHGLQRAVGVPSFTNERRARNPRSGRLDGPTVAVDFVRHAEAMGALAIAASSAQELREALTQALAEPRVRVIVVPTDPDARVPNFDGWWDVPVAEVSAQEGVQRAREVYERMSAGRRELRLATPEEEK